MEMMIHLLIGEKINKMVTAVQWLKAYIEFKRHVNTLTYSSIDEALEEALRMEKDQIIEAYCEGDDNVGAEEYYNKNYGNDNGE